MPYITDTANYTISVYLKGDMGQFQLWYNRIVNRSPFLQGNATEEWTNQEITVAAQPGTLFEIDINGPPGQHYLVDWKIDGLEIVKA
jgi:hypothetical protein